MMTKIGFAARAATGILLAAAVAPAGASAQDPEPGERECLCVDEIGVRAPDVRFFHVNRARIGVLLGEPEEVDDRMGVRVEEVTTGGPADRAGLRAGDVIIALDGRDLGDPPAPALIDAMRDVEPGDTVRVTFHREGERRSLPVVAARAEGMAFFGEGAPRPPVALERLREPGFRFRMAPDAPVPPGAGSVRVYRNLLRAGVDLVALNPRLGEYFGADEGVLVVDVDDDSPLGLVPGDVILSIDGRSVRDPAHARAILGSYRGDEEIDFVIVRDRRRMEISGTRGRKP